MDSGSKKQELTLGSQSEKAGEEDQEIMTKPQQEAVEAAATSKMQKKLLEKKTSLLSHMDSVRGLSYLDKEGVLASISEDCLVKLWNLKDPIKPEGFEPYFTLRGHTAPLFTICQSNSSAKERLLYTAGAEGQIRVWEVPEPSKIVPYGPSDGKNFCVGIWKAHEEPVWQLCAHPTNVASSFSFRKLIGLYNVRQRRLNHRSVESAVSCAESRKAFQGNSGQASKNIHIQWTQERRTY